MEDWRLKKARPFLDRAFFVIRGVLPGRHLIADHGTGRPILAIAFMLVRIALCIPCTSLRGGRAVARAKGFPCCASNNLLGVLIVEESQRFFPQNELFHDTYLQVGFPSEKRGYWIVELKIVLGPIKSEYDRLSRSALLYCKPNNSYEANVLIDNCVMMGNNCIG